MKRKSTNPEKPQLQLFDQDQPCPALPPIQKALLSVQVEALFVKIAEALAIGEAGDE